MEVILGGFILVGCREKGLPGGLLQESGV